jgi:Sensors of blue-light using FAD
MLVRLLYASRAVDPSPTVIDGILSQSRLFNPSSGITGILCFGGGVFLQAVEGGRVAVNKLYQHILRDPRHSEVTLLDYAEISERRFGGWTMGQVDMSRINPNLLLKYAEKAELDPFSVSGKMSLALLEELMATASIMGRA